MTSRSGADQASTSAGVRAVAIACMMIASVGLSLTLLEGVARVHGGYRLLPLALAPRPTVLPVPGPLIGGSVPPAVAAAAAAIPVPPDVEPGWFALNPPEVTRGAVDPALVERFRDFVRRGIYPPQAAYIWNAELLKTACEAKRDVFQAYPRDVKAFVPPGRSPHPAFRFPALQTLPSGLVTDRFGFRRSGYTAPEGTPIIRLAFLGASTTINDHEYRWSYPDFVGHYLNVWLEHQRRPERVEITNAAREGLAAEDIREIVRQEVVPLHPDYVVYTEGGSLLKPATVRWRGDVVPSGALAARHDAAIGLPPWLLKYSALANALNPVVLLTYVKRLREPARLPYILDLPSPEGVTRAQLDAVFGPALKTILDSLDEDTRAVTESGGTMIVSSVIRLVHEGLTLDPIKQRPAYDQLVGLLEPLSFADIRRTVDLQNAAYRQFARERSLDFLDLASVFPADDRLFGDSFHLIEPGVRLQGWLAFLQLKDIIGRDLGRTARAPRVAHVPETFQPFDTQLPACKPPSDAVRHSLTVDATTLQPLPSAAARQIAYDRGRARFVSDPHPGMYAAQLPLSVGRPPGEAAWIEVTMKVSTGSISVGVVNRTGTAFVSQRELTPADGTATIHLRIEPDQEVSALVFTTGATSIASQAEIDGVTLFEEHP